MWYVTFTSESSSDKNIKKTIEEFEKLKKNNKKIKKKPTPTNIQEEGWLKEKEQGTVKKFILTLSHVSTNIPKLTLLKIEEILKSLFPNAIVLIVKELHKGLSGFHYHAYIKCDGVSKNTYIKQTRELFPEFTGIQLDIQGVKTIKGTISYLLKDLKVEHLIAFVINDLKPTEWILCTIDFWKILPTDLKHTLKTVIRIIDFDNLDSWIKGRLVNITRAKQKIKQYEFLWEIRLDFKQKPFNLDFLFEPPKDINKEYFLCPHETIYRSLIKKWGLNDTHLFYLEHILYYILIHGGYYPIATKIKNLLVYGLPNTGKTSLIAKLQKLIGNRKSFFFLGSRSSDFSGYVKKWNPILVFDDILNIPLQWDHGLLLKVFGHESIYVDVKYKKPLFATPGLRVVITNLPNLFNGYLQNNLRCRFKFFELVGFAQWSRIPDWEFHFLVYYTLRILQNELKCPDYKNILDYGRYEFDWKKFSQFDLDMSSINWKYMAPWWRDQNWDPSKAPKDEPGYLIYKHFYDKYRGFIFEDEGEGEGDNDDNDIE